MKTDGTEKTEIDNGGPVGYLYIERDWIYYVKVDDGKFEDRNAGEIYKIKTDGTGNTMLDDNKTDSIIVVGDWIYYTKSRMFKFGNLDIFKMRIDGTKKLR